MVGSILSDMNYYVAPNTLLQVTTNRDEVYYGGKGIIIDPDYNILFMTTIIISPFSISSYMPSKIKCRISRDVFTRQDELMPKTIVKKFIPYYGTAVIPLVYDYYTVDNIRPEIIIGEAPNIIVEKVPPSPSIVSDEFFNNMLVSHINDL